MNDAQPFYRIRAAAGEEPDSAELLIFSAIGDWEELGETSASAFARDLSRLPTSVKRLDIHINSPGGSVSEANGIYSRLADHRSQKIVYVDGLAASAASIVAMVGHKIYIRANANMMIHLPSALAMGNADDMRTVASALDSVTESMINVYAKRTKLERDEIRSLLAAETWMSPQQAVDKGFADEVRGVIKTAAIAGTKRVIFNGIEHDLSRFNNVPAFTAITTKPRSNMNPTANANPPADPHEHDEHAPPPPAANPPPPPPAAPPPAPPPANPPPNAPPPPNTAPAGAPTAASDYDRGVQTERARVMALQKLDKPATHTIIEAAIKDGKTVADITEDVINAMERAGTQSARRSDASSLNGIPGSGADDASRTGDGFGSKVKAAIDRRRQGRSHNSRAIHSRS